MTSRHVIKIIRSIKGESGPHMKVRIKKSIKADKDRVIGALKFLEAQNRFVH